MLQPRNVATTDGVDSALFDRSTYYHNRKFQSGREAPALDCV